MDKNEWLKQYKKELKNWHDMPCGDWDGVLSRKEYYSKVNELYKNHLKNIFFLLKINYKYYITKLKMLEL